MGNPIDAEKNQLNKEKGNLGISTCFTNTSWYFMSLVWKFGKKKEKGEEVVRFIMVMTASLYINIYTYMCVCV